jgi:hypothetical protein
MRAGFSFSYPSISLLLGQPLSIKKSYAGAIQDVNINQYTKYMEKCTLKYRKKLENLNREKYGLFF